jgi:hypothetical protein
VQNGTLNDALEAKGWLGINVILTGNGWCVLIDKVGQILAQRIWLGAAGTERISRRGVVDQRKQQVFDRNEFVSFLARLDKSHVQADFEFLGNH